MGSGAGGLYGESSKTAHEQAESDGMRVHERSTAAFADNLHSWAGTIDHNAESVRARFGLSEDGYFCKRGTGRDDSFRQFRTNTPLQDAEEFYAKLGSGGITTPLPRGNGTKTQLADETIIVFRPATRTPDSPAVSIAHSASDLVRDQKVHFFQEG